MRAFFQLSDCARLADGALLGRRNVCYRSAVIRSKSSYVRSRMARIPSQEKKEEAKKKKKALYTFVRRCICT